MLLISRCTISALIPLAANTTDFPRAIDALNSATTRSTTPTTALGFNREKSEHTLVYSHDQASRRLVYGLEPLRGRPPIVSNCTAKVSGPR